MSAVQPADRPLVFDVTGMDCGDCAKSVERVVAVLPGVAASSVSFAAGTLTVDPAADADHDAVVRAVGGAVDRAGYAAALRRAGGRAAADQRPWWTSPRLVPAGIATALWLAAWLIDVLTTQETVAVALFAAAIVIGGARIVRACWAALRARRIDMNALMTISVIGAALLGEWSEGGLVVVLFAIGTTLQAITFDRTRGAIRALLDLAPQEARLVRDGGETVVAVATLVPGDLIRVRPGDRLAADGTVVDGHSAVDQAAITGESLPVERGSGDEVFAGTVNGSGTLLVRVEKVASGSVLAGIVHLVEQAQASKAPSQQMVDRFAAVYTPLVVAVAALIALAGGGITGDWDTWVYRALVLLVIACPCALVISTPVSIVSAIGAATRGGLLVKGGAALEDAGRTRTVAFDKTGTLTVGRPTVMGILPFGDPTAAEVLAVAAAVEDASEHPLGRAVVARALHDRVTIRSAEAFAALPGRGARATVGGATVMVGSLRLMRESAVDDAALRWGEGVATRSGALGHSTLAVARTDATGQPVLLGVIAVADRVRPGAREAVEALRRSGVERVVMLTGDRPEVARTIAAQLGVDDVRADLLPEEKAAAVQDLRTRYGAVAMVGDGVNDAPALAVADVGIAMGISGSDVALESADVTLFRDDLPALPWLFDLSQRTVAIIRQNVTLSLLTKVAALLLGTLGFVNLWVAVLLDMGTSLLVTANGLRLARAERRAAVKEDEPETAPVSSSAD